MGKIPSTVIFTGFFREFLQEIPLRDIRLKYDLHFIEEISEVL